MEKRKYKIVKYENDGCQRRCSGQNNQKSQIQGSPTCTSHPCAVVVSFVIYSLKIVHATCTFFALCAVFVFGLVANVKAKLMFLCGVLFVIRIQIRMQTWNV